MNDSGNLKKLANLMDDYYKKEHVRLAEYLIEKKVPGYESLKKKKESLQKHYFGGGSPTLAFFSANASKNPNDLVKKLKEFAREESREDLVQVLELVDDNTFLKELKVEMKEKIADLLEQKIDGVADWECLATYFSYSHIELEQFKKTQIYPGSFSPTKALFNILYEINRELPISHIIEWAVSCGRNDIADHLNTIKERKVESPINQTDNQNELAGLTDATDGGPSNQMANLSLNGEDEPDLT